MAVVAVLAASAGCIELLPGPEPLPTPSEPWRPQSFTYVGWEDHDSTWVVPDSQGQWNVTWTYTPSLPIQSYGADGRMEMVYTAWTQYEYRQGDRRFTDNTTHTYGRYGLETVQSQVEFHGGNITTRWNYLPGCYDAGWPDLAVGVRWNETCTWTETSGEGAPRYGNGTYATRVVAREGITVPAGAFGTWRLVLDDTVDGKTTTSTAWYARLCGEWSMVRQVFPGGVDELAAFDCGG